MITHAPYLGLVLALSPGEVRNRLARDFPVNLIGTSTGVVSLYFKGKSPNRHDYYTYTLGSDTCHLTGTITAFHSPEALHDTIMQLERSAKTFINRRKK